VGFRLTIKPSTGKRSDNAEFRNRHEHAQKNHATGEIWRYITLQLQDSEEVDSEIKGKITRVKALVITIWQSDSSGDRD
jgi:hypothetical protein